MSRAGEALRELYGPYDKDIHEPELPWPDDGGMRRVDVVDPNWLVDGKPRVIRRIGWRNCMCCKKRSFRQASQPFACENCKESKTDKSSY